MEVTARLATPDDLPALGQLATEAIEELTPHRGGELWRRQSARPVPPDASLSADLDDDTVDVVVGCIDDVPVGYGVMRAEPLQDDSLLGVITDLYTLPGAREVSVGETVMNLLIDHATARGCIGVDSVALPGDRETKNFFESFGLKARQLVVHRSLTES